MAKEPEPVRDYGYGGDREQLYYDRRAFAERLSVASGCPPRSMLFKQIADKLVPDWFEWHPWTNRVVDTLCKRRWVGLCGCANCVSGDTRIFNPTTGESPTIKQLCENKEAPTVMTLWGPRVAGVPFVKGVSDLLEVVMEDGRRFVATAEHVVLSASGFVHVKSLSPGLALFAYDQSLLGSNSERGPLTRTRDAFHSPKKAEGSQSGCPPGSSFYGEQLQRAREACRLPFPSEGGALIRIRDGSCVGGLALSGTRNPCGSHAGHLSTEGFDPHRSFLDTPSLLQPDQEIDGPSCRSFQQFERSPSGSGFHSPFLERVRDFGYKPKACSLSEHQSLLGRKTYEAAGRRLVPPLRFHQSPCGLEEARQFFPETGCMDLGFESTGLNHEMCALSPMVSQIKVVSIRNLGRGAFYDMEVPGVEHYFAEGTIHHNSCKTRNVAGFAATWWLCAPTESSVIFCSTTMKSMRKRGWAEIQNYYYTLGKTGGLFGNFVDSRTVWQSKQGDDRNAIFGIAVQEGNTDDVAANIQGIHTKRQMVVIDEAEAVPAAIWKACANLYSYPVDVGGEFILVAIANPRSRLSQFGRFIEPEDGYDSIGIDTEEWESRPQLDGKKALVVRFDFCKSPNITEGKEVSKHLPKKSRVEAKMAALAARGAENDPDHLAFDRGYPAPEGMAKTVFSSTMLDKHDGYGRHDFTGNDFRIIGVFDQSRGGDRPALRFSAMGEIRPGVLGIELMPAITLFLDGTSKEPIAYQLMHKLRTNCERLTYRGRTYRCLPGDLAIDCTNEASFTDLCQKEWDPAIMRIIFSGACSSDPVSHEDPRQACDVYRNKRAEMYFRSRSALESGQLKGMDKETASELCNMEYHDLKKDGTSCPITIIDKKEYKLKFTVSPDFADTVGMTSEVARIKGFKVIATGYTVNRESELVEVVKKAEAVYQDIAYSPDNDEEQPDDFYSVEEIM